MSQDMVCVEPSQTAKACVIWLHGLGADGYDFQPIIPCLGLPKELVRFLFPHADIMPVTVNGGAPMRAWYDILEMNIERKVDEISLMRSSARIHSLITEQIQAGVAADKIFVIGFSQGGAVAYQAALTYPKMLGGVAALSTYLASYEILEKQPLNAKTELPIWISHGDQDEVVARVLGERALTFLTDRGFAPQWITYTMGHEVCLEQMQALGQWLGQQLGDLD